MPAKRETEHATIATLIAASPRWGERARDRQRLGAARSTIQDNLKRAAAAGLAWPLAEGVTDDALERQLFGRAGVAQGQRRRVEPDWAALARELKRPGVTMTILWEEYREAYPEGYGYSRFCDLLRGFERRLTPVMRQHHVAGEKAFVDYSGKRIGIVDPSTGEIREADICSRRHARLDGLPKADLVGEQYAAAELLQYLAHGLGLMPMRLDALEVRNAEAEPSQRLLRQRIATAPGEGKGVAQHWTDVFFHFTFQECATAMQTRLHRLRQDAEQLRRLLDAHALDQSRDHDSAERLRKLVDGALE